MLIKRVQKYIFGSSIVLNGSEEDTYFEWLTNTPGLPEEDVVRLILATVKNDSWQVDVGANLGYISLIMALLARKGNIFSFEPAPKTFSLLKLNIKQNNFKNVKIFNYGLSDSAKSALLTQAENNTAGGFVNTEIPKDIKGHINEKIELRKLDQEYAQLGIKKCELLKVDIEGHEASFLKGAKKFISEFKPFAIIEANHWCLNIFNRQSLPDFIEETLTYFPVIYAFNDRQYLDLANKDARYKFYYENTVNNKFTNLYCGFDRKKTLQNLTAAFASFGDQKATIIENELTNVRIALDQLSVEKNDMISAKSYKAIKKINSILGR